ncbi:MAG: anthranilate synthase component I [Acidobacteriota bacterium]|nr:anthranilate synthase component I [Acidobacteriota bacterium]
MGRSPSAANATEPSPRGFAALARAHTLVPVYRTVTADLETPVSAFLRITQAAGATPQPEAFLLESVEGGEHVGRYTFIGIEPYRKMTSRGRSILIEEGVQTREFEGDIFEELKKALGGHTPARLPGLPPFTAGAVGFFAYDVVRQIERLPSLAKDELDVPDACLMFFDQVLAFDHVKKEIHLIVTADLTPPTPGRRLAAAAVEAAYRRAIRRLNRLERRLAQPLPRPPRRIAKQSTALALKPRTSKAAFLRSVAKTKEYIASGDVFQCVLSQRFDCVPGVDPFSIYRSLRIVNPSPYMYFLQLQGGRTLSGKKKTAGHGFHIVGSSPELLVRVHDRAVEYRPIAGTRPRSEDEAEDRALEADLRANEKELAEHVMLVDLGRNDVGRVSEYGSVKVKELMVVERYSHVMHLVSSLEGRLKEGLDPLDALKACFPAGTLSGAPKIRAMEIIEELEPVRRGVYGGAVLYADFSGNLDSCIAIRTLVLRDAEGSIQAGAGIVADSVAEKEYEECGNKARAVVRAIERARRQ